MSVQEDFHVIECSGDLYVSELLLYMNHSIQFFVYISVLCMYYLVDAMNIPQAWSWDLSLYWVNFLVTAWLPVLLLFWMGVVLLTCCSCSLWTWIAWFLILNFHHLLCRYPNLTSTDLWEYEKCVVMLLMYSDR